MRKGGQGDRTAVARNVKEPQAESLETERRALVANACARGAVGRIELFLQEKMQRSGGRVKQIARRTVE